MINLSSEDTYIDTQDFLVSLIKKYTLDYELSGSAAEIRESFRSEALKYLQRYVESLDTALEAINSRATTFFETDATATNNADANLSKLFELKIAYQITKWVAKEETLKGNSIKLKLAYATKISSFDVGLILAETIEASKLALIAHVAKAQISASNWTDQMKSLGVSAIMHDTRETIDRFSNLTISDLSRSLDP